MDFPYRGCGVCWVWGAHLFILPNTPEKVKRWFTEEEKKIALRRTKEAYNIPNTKISLGQLKATVRDPKTWFYCEFS